MTVELTFLTTTFNGSYDRLAKRQQKVLAKEGIISEVITSAHTSRQPIHGKHILIYSTFNTIPQIIKIYDLKPDNTVFLADSALITIPYLTIKELIKKGYRIYTVSQFNKTNFESFGIEINYVPHFVPDPNPSKEILRREDRDIDFLSVGINERDFDRKGIYWNWLTEIFGFRAVRICKNLCYGKSLEDVPDDFLYGLYKKSKWYLAMSHSESPHLPLIEAFAFGTPTIFLYAHEFMFLGVNRGLPVSVSFVTVKGKKNFWFYEIDPESFVDVIAKAYQISDEEYNTFSQNARSLFESEFKMENRLKEFKSLVEL